MVSFNARHRPQEIVKISLKTDDDKTARSRWGGIHAQFEAMMEQAPRRMREKSKGAEAREQLMKAEVPSNREVAPIAAQAHYDVLAADDKLWDGPDAMTPKAHIIARISAERDPDERGVSKIASAK